MAYLGINRNIFRQVLDNFTIFVTMKFHYLLVRTARDPKAPKSVYLKYNQSRVSAQEKVYAKDWDKKMKMPKLQGGALYKRLGRMLKHIELKSSNITLPKETAEMTTLLAKWVDLYKSNPTANPHDNKKEFVVTLDELCEAFKSRNKYKKWFQNAKEGNDGHLKTWNTFFNQHLPALVSHVGYEIVITKMTVDLIDDINDWVDTYNNFKKNSTRNKFLQKWREMLSFGMGYWIELKVPLARFENRVEDNSGEMVMLTPEELQKFADYKFSQEVDKRVQELYLLGCEIGQHIQDFLKYSAENMTVTPKGNYELLNRRSKNGKSVRAIIIDQRSKDAYDKYLPHTKWQQSYGKAQQIFNDKLKDLCRVVGLDREVFTTKSGTGYNDDYPLYYVITFKSARKHFATYKRALFSKEEYEIWTGHSVKVADTFYSDGEAYSKSVVASMEEKLIENSKE